MLTTSDPTAVSSKGIEQGGVAPEPKSPDFSWAVPASFARLNEVKINGRQGVIANVGEDTRRQKVEFDLNNLMSQISTPEIPTVAEALSPSPSVADAEVGSLTKQFAKKKLQTEADLLNVIGTIRSERQSRKEEPTKVAPESSTLVTADNLFAPVIAALTKIIPFSGTESDVQKAANRAAKKQALHSQAA